MTAIKKTTKSKTSPAPATKPAPKSRKKSAVTAKVSAPVSLAEPPPVVTTPATVETIPSIPSAPVVTTITARVDVGFGNTLYLRGEGPGLSWERGVPMICVADDRWEITLPESSSPYLFKFLINDVTWCVGPDYSVASGSSATLTPAF